MTADVAHEDNAAFIVVALSHNDEIERLKNARSGESRNHVVYTTHPGEALAYVRDTLKPVHFVVTGQLFFRTNSTVSEDYLKSITSGMSGETNPFPHSHPIIKTGPELADVVHQLNDRILVLRYSLSRVRNTSMIIGDIPRKLNVVTPAARAFLDCDGLYDAWQERDWAKLRSMLPGIQFYHTLEEHFSKGAQDL